jgi:hypothetical protein
MRFRIVVLASLLAPSPALADDTIKHPGDHPQYSVEIEPHLDLGLFNGFYGATGIGVGGRFTIPIVDNGFVKTINNSVGIGFGADWLHYSSCFYTGFVGGCSANYLIFPVVMQWNFFVAQSWSVFGEPGLAIYKGFYNACDPAFRDCHEPAGFGVLPAVYVGGRYYFSEHLALTMRVGYPTFSVGVSFM